MTHTKTDEMDYVSDPWANMPVEVRRFASSNPEVFKAVVQWREANPSPAVEGMQRALNNIASGHCMTLEIAQKLADEAINSYEKETAR